MKPLRILAAALIVLTSLLPASAQQRQTGSTDSIKKIYGIAVDPATNGGTVLIATQYGLLRARPDGLSELVPSLKAAVVSLATDPDDPNHLFASTVDSKGAPGNLMESTDGGITWAPVEGAKPVIVGALSLSRMKPGRMVGLASKIMVSDDTGKTWRTLAATPDKTFAVAPSPTIADRIYAGTMTGLMVSDDNGATWRDAGAGNQPITMITGLADGRLLAFAYSRGLLGAREPDLKWTLLAEGFEDRFMVDLAQNPQRPDEVFATFDTGAILMSRDGGRKWISFEGSDWATPEHIANGKKLFQQNCQACHGVNGIGEAPGNPSAKDKYGFKAPALNNDAHAWHHSDRGIFATISKGSPRNRRMVAFSMRLSDDEIRDIVAYIKTLWSLRSLACQGARHRGCQ